MIHNRHPGLFQELATTRQHHLAAAWDLCVNDRAFVKVPEASPPDAVVEFRVMEQHASTAQPPPEMSLPDNGNTAGAV